MPEKFSYVKKGYDPEEVEKYIETLETVIKSYKEKDSAIKNAIISAQIAADNIIKEAKEESARMKSIALENLYAIEQSIADQKRLVHEFQIDYNNMVNRYLQKFNDSDILQLYSKINELEEYMVSLHNHLKVNGFAQD